MSIPVLEWNIDFSCSKKFEKLVHTFVNARNMYAFPTIREKNQVKDDDIDLSIINKVDKSLELERKDAYTKAPLEHREKKDKQDIFLDNKPKNVDEIINTMTPKTLTQDKMKLLENNDKKNHRLPIKEKQVMASMGILDSKIASCQPPVFASCMIGFAQKNP